jgi:hypothetical protein
MTQHRQAIESAWEDLLEAFGAACQEARSEKHRESASAREVAARLDTLQAALRGLSNAWVAIRDQLPTEAPDIAKAEQPAGSLPQSAYYKPLAQALRALGGSASTQQAIAGVGKRLKQQFTTADYDPVPVTGQIRWVVNVRYARLQLREHGLILAHTPAGEWTLTDAGIRWADDASLPDLPGPIPQPDQNQQLLPF